MRTTIRLDDALLRDLKLIAAQSDRSLTSLIEEAVRELLARRERPRETRAAIRLTTVGGRGPQPGVDLDDSAALLALMERGSGQR